MGDIVAWNSDAIVDIDSADNESGEEEEASETSNSKSISLSDAMNSYNTALQWAVENSRNANEIQTLRSIRDDICLLMIKKPIQKKISAFFVPK